MRAYVVVDLGFGDAGKGLLTDFLVRRFNAAVVVRYNGGSQAGHNVVAPDGRQHTFSQFSSGSFIPGVKTYLSKHVVVHPSALLVEGDILVGKGVADAFSRIRVSDQALIITPFHQAANHIREIARGSSRHGSCGVGVGEAVEDDLLDAGDSVRAGDLADIAALRRKLASIRTRKHAQLLELYQEQLSKGALAREWEIFEGEDVIEPWVSNISRIAALGLVTPDEVLQRWFSQAETVIFEGAQGVLLDADAGFHPFTTWSRCTAANAYDLIQELAPGSPVCQIGVLRCYAVRHGPGPLPTETDVLAPMISEHNQTNAWQGAVRYGWFDAVLARYSLGVTGGVDALLVTHLDALTRMKTWFYCPGYTGQLDFDPALIEVRDSDGVLENFRLPLTLPLAQREQFTQALAKVTPLLNACEPGGESVVQRIKSLLSQSVNMISTGPRAEHVKIIHPIPS